MEWLTNLREGLDTPPHQAAAVLAMTLLVLVLVYFLKRLLLKAAARAPEKIDSTLIQRLYRPVRVSVLVTDSSRASRSGAHALLLPTSWCHCSPASWFSTG